VLVEVLGCLQKYKEIDNASQALHMAKALNESVTHGACSLLRRPPAHEDTREGLPCRMVWNRGYSPCPEYLSWISNLLVTWSTVFFSQLHLVTSLRMDPKNVPQPGPTGSDQDTEQQTKTDSHIDEAKDVTSLQRLRRKADWRIVPLTFLCYLMNLIDKVAYNVSELITKSGS
jgi:hypothetical protein